LRSQTSAVHQLSFTTAYPANCKNDQGSDCWRNAKAVRRYLAAHPAKVIAERTEVESGRRGDRPMIREALWLCRVYSAKLVIARLDRLARSTAMIAGLLGQSARASC